MFEAFFIVNNWEFIFYARKIFRLFFVDFSKKVKVHKKSFYLKNLVKAFCF